MIHAIMYDASDDAIRTALQELSSCSTLPSFSLTFYHHIEQLVGTLPGDDEGRLCFAGLLEVELQYHQALSELTERQSISAEELRSPIDRRNVGLGCILEQCNHTRRHSEASSVLSALLVSAAACYLLRRTDAMVSALQEAVDRGLRWPIVHLSLGYGHYLVALERYAENGPDDETAVLRDPISFQVECLRATQALQAGLNGSEWDEHLYQWMGQVLEAAGLTDAAQDAYDRCVAGMDDEDREDAGGNGSPASRSSLPAITEDEVRLAGELLKGHFRASEIMEGDWDRP